MPYSIEGIPQAEAWHVWMAAARDAAFELLHGSTLAATWGPLGKLILETLDAGSHQADDEVVSRWRRGSSRNAYVSRFGTALPPTVARMRREHPALFRAAVSTVERLLPVPPDGLGGWGAVPFHELARNIDKTTPMVPTKPPREGWLEQQCAPHELDLAGETGLGLTSWAFENTVPPYVTRTVDDDIDAMLASPTGRLTLLVGPPKSGKTRLVVEALRRSLPASTVWWVQCAPGVVPDLAHRAVRELTSPGGTRDPTLASRGLVIVLDDLQRCGANPVDGISGGALGRLTAVARVVGTLHDTELARWRAQMIDRTAPGEQELTHVGATRELVSALDAAAVTISPVLDAEERGRAEALLAASGADGELPPRAHRWAEWLASVDALRSRAIDLGWHRGGYRRAVVEAALDAAYLYYPSPTEDELEGLAAFHFKLTSPTRHWDPERYRSALDWATTPIGGSGSVHAVVHADHDQGGYRLIDALQEPLSTLRGPQGWTPDHLWTAPNLSHIALANAGLFATTDEDQRSWWERATAAGDGMAPHWLASRIFHSDPDDATAMRLWKLAAERGNRAAMEIYASLLLRGEGDRYSAMLWLDRAERAGSASAQNLMGIELHRRGIERSSETLLRRARDCFSRGAAKGDRDSMLNLSRWLLARGSVKKAKRWLDGCEDLDTYARLLILHDVWLDDTTGPLREPQYSGPPQGAHAVDTDAMIRAAQRAFGDGDARRARRHLSQAAQRGDVRAQFRLGLQEYLAFHRSTSQWQRALRSPQRPTDDEQRATLRWREAALVLQEPRAAFNVGVLGMAWGDDDLAAHCFGIVSQTGFLPEPRHWPAATWRDGIDPTGLEAWHPTPEVYDQRLSHQFPAPTSELGF